MVRSRLPGRRHGRPEPGVSAGSAGCRPSPLAADGSQRSGFPLAAAGPGPGGGVAPVVLRACLAFWGGRAARLVLVPAGGLAGKLEADGGGGAGRAVADGGVVGDLTGQPEPAAGRAGPGCAAVRPGAAARGAVVADLAVQLVLAGPQPQPSPAAAVADRVGGQLVHGRDDLVGPRPGQPGGRRGRRRPGPGPRPPAAAGTPTCPDP